MHRDLTLACFAWLRAPVPDMAWGYEENQDGVLVLQVPQRHPPGSTCGPGSYSPTDCFMPHSPRYDFGRSLGREPPERHTDWTDVEEDDSSASTISDGIGASAPTRRPMPIAAVLQRGSRPQIKAKPIEPASPLPGPGAFAFPLGIGDKLPVSKPLPLQARFFARGVGSVKLPLSPGRRGRHLDQPLRTEVPLGIQRAELAPPKPPEARRFNRHDLQLGSYHSWRSENHGENHAHAHEDDAADPDIAPTPRHDKRQIYLEEMLVEEGHRHGRVLDPLPPASTPDPGA